MACLDAHVWRTREQNGERENGLRRELPEMVRAAWLEIISPKQFI